MNHPVDGYDGLYEVSDRGAVYSVRSGKELKQWMLRNKNGRTDYCVSLCKDGKKQNMLVARLVAIAFIPNPNDLPQVNHIDGDNHNNNVENLEWISNRDNTIHAYKNHLRKRKIIWVTDGSEIIPLRSLCIRENVNYKKVHYRIKNLGWDLTKAIDEKRGWSLCRV